MTTSEELDNSINLEEKSPPSTSLFNRLSLLCATIALLLIIIGVISYQVDSDVGLNVIASIYLPSTIIWLFAMYLAIAERLRASYLAAVAVFEVIKYGSFYIAPFNPPPVKL